VTESSFAPKKFAPLRLTAAPSAVTPILMRNVVSVRGFAPDTPAQEISRLAPLRSASLALATLVLLASACSLPAPRSADIPKGTGWRCVKDEKSGYGLCARDVPHCADLRQTIIDGGGLASDCVAATTAYCHTFTNNGVVVAMCYPENDLCEGQAEKHSDEGGVANVTGCSSYE
jgi:hypothetical protein